MTDEPIDIKRKRLIFRSWHRGTREMDLLMGSFADCHVLNFSGEQLALYDDILNHNDPDLYDWIIGRVAIPANVKNDVLDLLTAHRFQSAS